MSEHLKQLNIAVKHPAIADFAKEISELGDTGAIILDSTLQIVFWNNRIAALTGIPHASTTNKKLFQVLQHFTNSALEVSVNKALKQMLASVIADSPEQPLVLPVKPLRSPAHAISLSHSISVKPITSFDADIYCLIQVKTVDGQLEPAFNYATAALEVISDAVIVIDSNNMIQYTNPAAEQMTAWCQSNAQGKSLHSILKIYNEKNHEPILISCNEVGNSGASTRRLAVTVVRKDHVSIPAELTLSAITTPDNDEQGIGANSGLILVLRSQFEKKEYDRKLEWQSTHDPLTGLLNRSAFEKRLQHFIDISSNDINQPCLLYLDLDQFKVINDSHGHTAGDELLQQVADLLQSRLRNQDILARLGGDEFGILLDNCPVAMAYKFAEEIGISIHNTDFTWHDKIHNLTVSVGIAPITRNTRSYVALLSYADTACYIAKDAGRNCIHIHEFTNSALIKRRNEMQWIYQLQSAMSHNNLLLLGQKIIPINQVSTLKPHLEVLLRLVDNETLVSPSEFILAAEKFNLMPKIDRWVFKNTLDILRNKDLSAWDAININFSGQSFSDSSIVKFITDEIMESGLNPAKICFEITETAAINDLESAAKFMHKLKSMGCQFALDDFGSGLSSFSYLKKLPFDFLKIDGEYIQKMNENRVNYAMLETINQIGHVFGAKTVAEYVESEELLEQLRKMGVDYAQGYAITKPTPLKEIFSK